MSKVTKKHISDFIKKKYSTSNDTSYEIVEAFFRTIVNLAQKDEAVLKNFGKFCLIEKKITKKLYNFQTKQMEEKHIEISKIHFLKSRNLKS